MVENVLLLVVCMCRYKEFAYQVEVYIIREIISSKFVACNCSVMSLGHI